MELFLLSVRWLYIIHSNLLWICEASVAILPSLQQKKSSFSATQRRKFTEKELSWFFIFPLFIDISVKRFHRQREREKRLRTRFHAIYSVSWHHYPQHVEQACKASSGEGNFVAKISQQQLFSWKNFVSF